MSKIFLLYEMKKKLNAVQLEKELLITAKKTAVQAHQQVKIQDLDALIKNMERQIEHVKNLAL